MQSKICGVLILKSTCAFICLPKPKYGFKNWRMVQCNIVHNNFIVIANCYWTEILYQLYGLSNFFIFCIDLMSQESIRRNTMKFMTLCPTVYPFLYLCLWFSKEKSTRELVCDTNVSHELRIFHEPEVRQMEQAYGYIINILFMQKAFREWQNNVYLSLTSLISLDGSQILAFNNEFLNFNFILRFSS